LLDVAGEQALLKAVSLVPHSDRANVTCDKKRRAALSKGYTEANEETTSDEHVNVDTSSLKSYSKKHDEAADDDTDSASKDIGHVGEDRE